MHLDRFHTSRVRRNIAETLQEISPGRNPSSVRFVRHSSIPAASWPSALLQAGFPEAKEVSGPSLVADSQ